MKKVDLIAANAIFFPTQKLSLFNFGKAHFSIFRFCTNDQLKKL